MVLFDHRMVEGRPLWYHYQPEPVYFYQRQEKGEFLDYNFNMSEDLLAPRSPQSDSENSMSSVEVSIASQSKEIQCRWMNCGALFETLDQLASHVGKTHASSGAGGLFYCGWEGCTRNDRGFNARYKMLVHVRTHTNEKPHQCCQCSKSFSRAENLKIHARSHSGEKPYVCNVAGCNKAYSNSSDRFKHSRTHQEDKPYQCKIPGCPKRYTDPSSLRKHVKTYKHYASDVTYDDEEKAKKAQAVRKCQNNGCCAPDDCLGERAAEIFKFGAFINSRVRCWDQLLDPFIKPSFEMEIDLDTPLDLSISRKQ